MQCRGMPEHATLCHTLQVPKISSQFMQFVNIAKFILHNVLLEVFL